MVTATEKIFRRLTISLLGGLGTCFVQAQPTYNYRLVDDSCNLNQCFFIEQAVEDAGYFDYVVGTVRVTGYYGSIAREDRTTETMGLQKPRLYPALIVTSAPPFFQSAFRTLIRRGNTVNRLNDEDQLVLATSFSNLKASEVNRVKSATRLHPVSLTLFKPPPH